MAMKRAGDVFLNVVEQGSGAPVLLIHGTQPDGAVFAPLMEKLGSDVRAIAYDRRGFSGSEGERGAAYDRHARDAASLLDEMQAAPAIVVGWSWGGLIAFELAAARPDLVRSLVLVEPAFHLKKHPTFAVLRAVLGAQLRGAIGRKTQAVDGFFNWALGRAGETSSYWTIDESYRRIVHRNAAAILAEIALGTGEKLSAERVAAIGAPATILVGALSDPAFKAAAARVGLLLRNARTIDIAKAGHAIPFDQPGLLADIIRAEAATAFAA